MKNNATQSAIEDLRPSLTEIDAQKPSFISVDPTLVAAGTDRTYDEAGQTYDQTGLTYDGITEFSDKAPNMYEVVNL